MLRFSKVDEVTKYVWPLFVACSRLRRTCEPQRLKPARGVAIPARINAPPFKAKSLRPALQTVCSPFPLLHQPHEVLKQIVRVVRSGRRLWVILHAEQRQRAMSQALERLVVEVDVREIDFRALQRIRID